MEVSGDKIKLAFEIAKQRNPGQRKATSRNVQEIMICLKIYHLGP